MIHFSKFYSISLLLMILISTNIISQNLLLNGDFENGGSGFGFNVNGAGYTLLTPPFTGSTVPGNYAFVNNPQILNNDFFIAGGDHTTGTGWMMVIDGNTTGGSQRFWRAGGFGGGVCGLTPGTQYSFSYWIKSVATSVTNNATRADIGIQFNNVSNFNLVSGSPLSPLPAEVWQKVTYQFTATNNCVNIELWNNNTNAVGNDFAVDDFEVLGPNSFLTVNYSMNQMSCVNANDGFIVAYVRGGTAPYQFTLTGNNGVNVTNSTGIFPNLIPGTYTVSISDIVTNNEVI